MLLHVRFLGLTITTTLIPFTTSSYISGLMVVYLLTALLAVLWVYSAPRPPRGRETALMLLTLFVHYSVAATVMWGLTVLFEDLVAVVLAASMVLFAASLAAGVYERFTTVKRGPRTHFRKDGTPKHSYRTLEGAENAAGGYKDRHGDRMSAYECERGGHFHIGHSSRK